MSSCCFNYGGSGSLFENLIFVQFSNFPSRMRGNSYEDIKLGWGKFKKFGQALLWRRSAFDLFLIFFPEPSTMFSCTDIVALLNGSFSPAFASWQFVVGLLPWEWKIFRYGVSKTLMILIAWWHIAYSEICPVLWRVSKPLRSPWPQSVLRTTAQGVWFPLWTELSWNWLSTPTLWSWWS